VYHCSETGLSYSASEKYGKASRTNDMSPLSRTSGVSLMSGFSANMMKVFMDGGEDVEEVEVVEVDGQEGEVVVKKVKQKMTPE
jgi:Domain of unknown function (DUF2828)